MVYEGDLLCWLRLGWLNKVYVCLKPNICVLISSVLKYIYIYIYIYVYMHIHIYIYIERERDLT